jgi:hypothetical protein
MSALRRALHACADLIADALEEDAAAAANTAPKIAPPKGRKSRERKPAPIPDKPVSDAARERAAHQLRKAGIL